MMMCFFSNSLLLHLRLHSSLIPSQQQESMLSFEGQEIQGPNDIIQKYTSLGSLQHNIPEFTMDVQVKRKFLFILA